MKKEIRYLVCAICVIGLVAVRAFLEPYFYDPFLHYFKGDYLSEPFPQLNYFNFFLNISGRFWLNSLLSIIIIHTIFNKVETTKFVFKLYVISFIVLIFLFFILLKHELTSNYLVIFYIRRILIHPVLVLLLIPAIIYQVKNSGVST